MFRRSNYWPAAVLLVVAASASAETPPTKSTAPPRQPPAESIPAAGAEADGKTVVEKVTPRPRLPGGGSLGTMFYEPSAAEAPFYRRLDKNEVATGGLAGAYDIAARNGKFVGWFGVVRDVAEDAAAGTTTLLVEHKYFDGLTDTHIQSLSFDGSGDFHAVLRGTGYGIPRLSLVKVYGTAEMKRGTPEQPVGTVTAEFVRNWDWGAFTFMFAEGGQDGNPRWRALNTVAPDDIYDPYPDEAYYVSRLGKR